MKVRIFKGDFYEIGQQLGKIYKSNGMNFDKGKIDSVLYKNQLKIYEKHYPELLEEFNGIAKSGGFDEKKLIYYFITNEIYYYRKYCYKRNYKRKKHKLNKACTIFGFKTGNNLFVGRNYDWIPETKKIFEVYKVLNPKRNSFIAVTDMGITSSATAKPKYFSYEADDAINDKGLYIGITFACADKLLYGISSIHMTKIIAETCETVKDAIEVFEKIPLCCPKNFFIADKNADMVIVEHTSKKFKVIYPENNILVKTNHYLDRELAREDKILKLFPRHNTFKRYNEVFNEINREKDNFNINTIIKILRRPRSHVYQNFRRLKTIWTLALNMTNREYKIYWDTLGKRKKAELKI